MTHPEGAHPEGARAARTGRSVPFAVSALIVAVLTVGAFGGGARPAHASTTPPTHEVSLSSVAPRSASTLPTQAVPAPADVVRAYFSAINDGRFVDAWALGGKNIVSGRYDDFVASFANTANDDVTVTFVNGTTVGVKLDATQSDGSHRFFAGTYTVQNGVIVQANIHSE